MGDCVVVKSYNFYSCMNKKDIPKLLEQVKKYEENIEKFGPSIDSTNDIVEDYDSSAESNENNEYDKALIENTNIYSDMDINFQDMFRFYTLNGIEIKYYTWQCCLKRESEGVIGLSLFYSEKNKIYQINDRKTDIDPLFDGKDISTFFCENDCAYCS